jgi:hypothetical protein
MRYPVFIEKGLRENGSRLSGAVVLPYAALPVHRGKTAACGLFALLKSPACEKSDTTRHRVNDTGQLVN